MALQRWTVGSSRGNAPTTAESPSNWDWADCTGSSGAPGWPVPRAGDSEGNQRVAIEGTWPGRCVSSVTTRSGARRKVMSSVPGTETPVRRANAGQPPDREAMLHVDDHDDSPSRREGRAPERRAEGTPCIDQAGSVAATRDVRVPAMSTRAWHNSRLTGLTLPSRFSSDGHWGRDAHRHHRRRVSVRATGMSLRRRREPKRTHVGQRDWRVRHSGEVTR